MEKFLKNLAKDVGKLLIEGFGKEKNTRSKTAWYDVLTDYDLLAETLIVKGIQKKFPSHGILTEESGHITKNKNFWVIDPIDGTYPFSHGWAQFSVSIGFVSNGRLECGLVYAPVLNELFFAQKGKGAELNGKPIKISVRKEFNAASAAVMASTAPTTMAERKALYGNVIKHKLWSGQAESVALTMAYTAMGRYDLVMLKNFMPWDYAGGAVILSEAGARLSDFKGRPFRWDMKDVIAANPAMHKKIINEFKLK